MVSVLQLRVVFTLIAFILPASGSDPNTFTDPKHDPLNPLKYIASNVLTGIAVCKYQARIIGSLLMPGGLNL